MLQDTPEAGTMQAAVYNMISALLQAGHTILHDDRSFDQAFFAQLMTVFKVHHLSGAAGAPTVGHASQHACLGILHLTHDILCCSSCVF